MSLVNGNKSSIYDIFKDAETYKVDINTDIEKWLSIYNGDPYGNESDDGRSSIVWKLVKKQTETLVANLTKTLLGSNKIAELEPITANDVIKQEIDEMLINYFYDHLPDKVNIIKTLVKVVVKEGTAWVKVGWKKVQTKNYIQIPENQQVNADMLRMNGIYKDDKGYYILETLHNFPKLEVIPNEDIYTDPLATSFHKSRFLFIRQEVTIDELKSNPILDGEKVEQWLSKYEESKSAALEAGSDMHDRELWRVDIEENDNKTIEKKMFLHEYWYKEKSKIKVKYLMFIDTEEYVLATKDINCKEFPFVPINLINKEFSIWGEGLPSLIDDEQRFMTSIIRGVVDNMSLSNNGQKFIKKGALDPVNFNRLMSNEPIVEVNTTNKLSDVFVDGFYNELPQAVYNMLQVVEQQAEGLTGISQNMQGINSNPNTPASNFQALMSQSQIRLNDFIINIHDGFKKIFTKWLIMSMKYLGDDEIFKITGISFADAKMKKFKELQAKYITPDIANDLVLKKQIEETIIKTIEDMFNKDTVKYDIKFKIGTDGMNQVKINQINMLMQQLGGLAESGHLPPMVIPQLMTKMSELLGFPEIAKEIKEYKPQPDPVQQQMTQLQMAELQAKAQKEQALAENARARSQNIAIKTKKDAVATQFDMANKIADIHKKDAETKKTMSEINSHKFENMKTYSQALKDMNEIKNGDKNESK